MKGVVISCKRKLYCFDNRDLMSAYYSWKYKYTIISKFWPKKILELANSQFSNLNAIENEVKNSSDKKYQIDLKQTSRIKKLIQDVSSKITHTNKALVLVSIFIILRKK